MKREAQLPITIPDLDRLARECPLLKGRVVEVYGSPENWIRVCHRLGRRVTGYIAIYDRNGSSLTSTYQVRECADPENYIDLLVRGGGAVDCRFWFF